jgi:hypothetical protein
MKRRALERLFYAACLGGAAAGLANVALTWHGGRGSAVLSLCMAILLLASTFLNNRLARQDGNNVER